MKASVIDVAGTAYEWSLHRQPRWTGGGTPLGLEVLVKPVKSKGRELVLEFDPPPVVHGDLPLLPRNPVSKRRLAECIQAALDAGWDPESRGKPHFHAAGPMAG